MDARRFGLSLALAALLSLPGCVQDDGRRLNPLRSEPFDVEQEREQGYAFDQEIQRHAPLIDDPVVLEAVQRLGQQIVAQIEPQPFVYRFRVIVDPQLNAFAVPGGFVYLHTGTVLGASSVEELVGVLGHEIGHVKGRHAARLQEQAMVPNLLTSFAGIAAAIGTGEPGFAIAAQGINVAIQLKYTREFEDEADRIGSIFMARAGYQPLGMARFFERIVLQSERPAVELPPYLYSHPDVKERIRTVQRYAEQLSVAKVAPALSREELQEAQTRLGLLLRENRRSWPLASKPSRATETGPLLREAEGLAAAQPDRALALLRRAEALDPADPSIPFRRGELLERLERHAEAIEAYRRTVRLDPTRALTFYQLARTYRASDDPVQATYYLEHAIRRFSPGGALQRRASFELEQLTFPVIQESGLHGGRDGGDGGGGADPADTFTASDERVTWWGLVSRHWWPYRHRIVVRWTDPSGQLVQESPVDLRSRPQVRAALALEPALAERHGSWRVEALLEGGVVDRRSFELRPAR